MQLGLYDCDAVAPGDGDRGVVVLSGPIVAHWATNLRSSVVFESPKAMARCLKALGGLNKPQNHPTPGRLRAGSFAGRGS